MKLNHILVGTDFSSHSDTAIRHGMEIVRATGATLRVVHVIEAPTDESALHAAVDSWHVDSRGLLTQQLQPYLAEDADIAHEIVRAPTVAEGLESAARAHHADLLVVGSRGLMGLELRLLGSEARRALRTVTTDVMVARGEPPVASGYKRVLIPTDFSLPAEKALQLALALAAADARFDVVHFWRAPEGAQTGEYSELVVDTIASSAKERGRELLESFQQDAPNATFSPVPASPERGIAEALQSGDYDLVVMGSYGRTKLRRWLLGSVSEHTAQIAQCSVAVARVDS